MRRFALVLALASALVAAPAFAQVSATDAALAEKLFEDGRQLMAKRRYEEACAKLTESQRLDGGVGTLLNLGECFEKAGKVASAWATYHQAEAAATRDGQRKRASFAAARAKALAPALSYLVIEADPSVQVTCDGRSVGASSLGSAMPFDAGIHTIEAIAMGKKPWSSSVELAPKATQRIVVPALEPEPVTPVVPPPVPPPVVVRATAPKAPSTTQRTVGIALGAAGVVGVGLGTFFGLRARSLNGDANARCGPTTCDREGFQLTSDAKDQATLSTIAFTLGAVALAGGLVLYLTAPRRSAQVAFAPAFVF